MTEIKRRGPRTKPVSRHFPCIECHAEDTALKPYTRCTPCSDRRWRDRAALRRQSESERRLRREHSHESWESARARLRESKEQARIEAHQVAHGVVTPYDAMTLQVEQETGTKSDTWNMIDERWNRVCFLTRAYLGIPHDPKMQRQGMQKGSRYERERAA